MSQHESTVARRVTLTHDPVPRPASARETAELQTTMLNTFAHELGNTSSPVALIAHSIILAPTTDRSVAVGRTLLSVASRLSQLVAIARVISGDSARRSVGAATSASHWMSAFAPFIESVLPDRLLLTIDSDDIVMPGSLVATLSWSLVAAAKYVADSSPAATSLCLRIRRTDDDHLCSEISAICDQPTFTSAARWLRAARSYAGMAGGTVRVQRTQPIPSCLVRLPLRETAQHPRAYRERG